MKTFTELVDTVFRSIGKLLAIYVVICLAAAITPALITPSVLWWWRTHMGAGFLICITVFILFNILRKGDIQKKG